MAPSFVHSPESLMRRTLLALALALPLAATACLGEDPIAPALPVDQVEFAPALGVDLAASTELPSGLWFRDITEGTSTQPAVADTVYVSYDGRLTNGTRFDQGKFGFRLGRNETIAGFDQGVSTMKVGGRRQLIIPPHLGYGPQWVMTNTKVEIPPNSWLVFDVTVDSIKVATTE